MEVLMNPAPFFPAPLDTPADIARLRERVDVHRELDYVFAAITRTRHALRGEVPLIGFCGAPWTLFSYMIEGGGSKTLQKAKTWLFKYPQESKALLARIADICVHFLVGQIDAGAQVSFTSLLTVFQRPHPRTLCRSSSLHGPHGRGNCGARIYVAIASVRFMGRRAFPGRFCRVRTSAAPAHRLVRPCTPHGESSPLNPSRTICQRSQRACVSRGGSGIRLRCPRPRLVRRAGGRAHSGIE